MALLAESLNHSKRFEAVDCMNRFVNWRRRGHVGAPGELLAANAFYNS